MNKTLQNVIEFTEVYKKYSNYPKAIREAMCLKKQFEYYFTEIREGDLFAGRIEYPPVGFGLEPAAGGSVYYCRREKLLQLAEELNNQEEKEKIFEVIEFWSQEMFFDHDINIGEPAKYGKLLKKLPKDLYEATTNSIAEMWARLSGTCIDYDKLLKLGLPGLIEEVKRYRNKALEKGLDTSFYDGALIVLNEICEVMRRYSFQAKELAKKSDNNEWRNEAMIMSYILEKLTYQKPETFREAIQLMWIYALAAGTVNYGRMDVYLGDFYVNDLEKGRISEEKAAELLKSLWILISERKGKEKFDFNSRVIIGGMGRRNEENADKFALLALEVTRQLSLTEPQLTLRIYEGMCDAVFEKALECLGEGKVYPLLYNDDINVLAVSEAFGVSFEEAKQYVPYGCGEYVIDHKSFGSPNGFFNLLKALEVLLNNGIDVIQNKKLYSNQFRAEDCKSFDELYDNYKSLLKYYIEKMAERHKIELETEKEEASFLLVSILYDYCLERGKSIVEGGAAYTGGLIEIFGLVNAADSLTAIKELVFEKKLISLKELIEVLNKNYEGYENIRMLCTNAPKYGNDIDSADAMVVDLSNFVCNTIKAQAKRVGLDYYLGVNINNWAHVIYGKLCMASADGRLAFAPLANGNNPTAGYDKNGLTAFLNSLVKINPFNHAGYVQNTKFSKQLFNQQREKTKALLQTYFKKGGTQAMITVIGRDDLENAMKEPEKYQNLIVRVGGFCARFVELPRDVQQEILNRTLY